MSDAKLVNIARLMTSYNFEIEQLPDNLKCAQCKLVLKGACQMPCGCRFCRACIDHMMACGIEFCPGESEDCEESPLSRFVTDYVANKSVYRSIAKCPNNECVHVCQLTNMEEHLRECPRNSEECPFRELGCTQDTLAAEEMGGHLQHENRRHSEILIGMIVNINREIETLKQRDAASSREIETLKQRDEASKREIETLTHVLELKDWQIRSIMDQMIHVQNENKSIKNDIKSIKEKNEDLAGRVRILSEQMEREIAERSENDELDSARVIDHVDREIAAVTNLIGSNTDELATKLQSVNSDIGSINQVVQSIKDDICSMKSQVQSTQELMGLGPFDASFVLLIDIDVGKTNLYKFSEYFTGTVHPYKYRLAIGIQDIGTTNASLRAYLRIYAGPNDAQLTWPFEAIVVITVKDRNTHNQFKRISQKCRIERPPNNDFRRSAPIEFLHSKLIKVGVELSLGVQVSCEITPGSYR